MIIDIVKKSANSKLLKFFFHDILKINLKELTLPRIFIFKVDDLKFDIKTFYDYALKNPKTNYMSDQIDTYQSDHDIERKPEFEKITRAMTNNPDLIAGEGYFDSELIKRGHNQIISKGGSEGIQCIGLLGEGIGLSIKVEDGSKRAKHAVAIHLLRQLEWITPSAIEELDEIILQKKPGIYIEVEGELKIP